MDTRKAFEIGRLHRDQPLMIFDWNKAAQIIKERNPQSASAGLKDDWGDEPADSFWPESALKILNSP